MKDGGSAFPTFLPGNPLFPRSSPDVRSQGMTLRDWFAGMALKGLLSANDGVNIQRVAAIFEISEGQAVCRIAYDTADHMIEEREREK